MGQGVALLILGFVGLLFFLWPNAMPHIARGIIVVVLVGGLAVVGLAGWLLYHEIIKGKVTQVQYACGLVPSSRVMPRDANGKLTDPEDLKWCRRAICGLASWHGETHQQFGRRCAGKEDW